MVPPQDAKRYCREVVRIIKLLKQSRDMTINEVKLTLAIEDPTQRERREYLGVEVRACSSRRRHAACPSLLHGSCMSLALTPLQRLQIPGHSGASCIAGFGSHCTTAPLEGGLGVH